VVNNIGEVLNLKVSDVSQRRLMLQEPKSGREVEAAFMPGHIANRLANYFANRNLSPDDKVFGICYTTARNLETRSSVSRYHPVIFGNIVPHTSVGTVSP